MAALLAIVWPGTAQATWSFSMSRIAGDSRYDTAARLAVDTFGKASGAIIATGETFPDALAASFVAGYVNSPILLVQRDNVPAATQQALTDLGVKEVVLLGGSAAISDRVQATLDENYDVVRLAGPDRFATAANIALAVNPGDVGELDGKRTAFLTYGYGFADALAVGPLSFAARFPILLNGSAGLGTPARVALDRLDIAHVVIVGGHISDAARQEVESMGITTERLQGPDRFATAAAVATFALQRLHFVPDHFTLTRGVDPRDPEGGFADALAGSVHAGSEQAPLLLTDAALLSDATGGWIEAHADMLATGDILGGEAAVSATVADAAMSAARRVAGDLTAFDLTTRTYAYQPDGASTPLTVRYMAEDRFTVDGHDATIDAFEGALSIGDRIRTTLAGGTLHALENVG